MTAQKLPPDYLDAMERHWLDADQLYGLSAECGLKALMMKWGMTLNPNNAPSLRSDRTHADEIWDRYEAYRQGGFSSLALPGARYFDDWSIHNRYASRSYFQQSVVDGHRQGAAIVKSLVAQARIEGVLP